jgi:hypothetical protein
MRRFVRVDHAGAVGEPGETLFLHRAPPRVVAADKTRFEIRTRWPVGKGPPSRLYDGRVSIGAARRVCPPMFPCS